MASKDLYRSQTHRPRKASHENPNHRSFYTQSVAAFDFDDTNDFGGSYSLVERNHSVLLQESFGKSFLGESLPGSKVMEKKKMADMDITFVEKSKWKKALVCRVCERDVDKKGSRHHCRICAGTVCGSCSERKINDQRVCDICFFKANTQQKEKIREDALDEKIKIIRQKKEELFQEQRTFEQKKAEYKNLKLEHRKKENEEEIGKEQQEKEKSEAEKVLNTTKDLNRSLASNIKRHQQLISDKESKLKGIQTKLSALKLEMSQKVQIYKKLQGEYQTKLSQRDNLQELNNNSSIASSTYGSSIIGRNYSVYSNGKGKYNISGQPVQI